MTEGEKTIVALLLGYFVVGPVAMLLGALLLWAFGVWS